MSETFSEESEITYGERPLWMADIYITTREDFSNQLTERELPEDAKDEYKKEVEAQQRLVKMLCDDPAMEEDREQIFVSPGIFKNRVYFMWQFCLRSLVNMHCLNHRLPAREKEMWDEVRGRCGFATVLILDDSGKVDAMFPGDTLTYSDELRELAKSIQEL
jgi:hypothetical protein